jgi:hypothetical protein
MVWSIIALLALLAGTLLVGERLSERRRRIEFDLRWRAAEYPQPHLWRRK